jgi:branched-chain amino acid transport system permease protein
VLSNHSIEAFGSAIPVSRFILPAMVVALTAVLAAVYRFSAFGAASRAASENEAFALLAGLSPSTLSLAGTIVGTLVAGGVGIVAASVTALDPGTLPVQVAPALAVALLARFTSWWITCLAGIGLGVVNSLLDYASTQTWFPTADGVALPGTKELLVFLLIIVIMFVRGSRIPGRGDIVEQRLPAVPRPGRPLLAAAAAAAVGAVALIVFPFDFRQALVNSLIGVVMALSLVVITGFVGQISVVQLGLAGVAGFTIAHASANWGLGFPVAAVLGIVAATAVGLLAAVSALRVRGVSLAIVTLAAATALSQFGFTNAIWGGGLTGSPVPEPHLLGVDIGPRAGFRGIDGNQPSPVFGLGLLAVVIVLCLLTVGIRRSSAGQRMLAVRSNERAAAAAGISVRNTKLAAFGASSFIAGTGGVLYAYNFGSVSAARFDLLTALALIAFAYVGGITMISGAVLAGLLSNQALVPFAVDRWLGLSGNYFVLFGGVMLLFTLIRNPEGAAGALARTVAARRPNRPAPVGAVATADSVVRPADSVVPAGVRPADGPVLP